MKPIQGWDQVQSKDGTGNRLPAGAYVCEIVSAQESTTKVGSPMLVVLFDIAEGPHKGHFREWYNAMRAGNADAKWRGVYNQPIYEKDGQASGFFKGLLTVIEASNPGYKWAWNETTLKGKKIGFVFREEEFVASDGSVKTSTKPAWPRTVDDVRKGIDPPAIKKLSGGNGFTPTNDFPPSFGAPEASQNEKMPWD